MTSKHTIFVPFASFSRSGKLQEMRKQTAEQVVSLGKDALVMCSDHQAAEHELEWWLGRFDQIEASIEGGGVRLTFKGTK